MYKSLQLLAISSLIVRNLKKINEEMIRKVLLLLCFIALTNAGVIRTEYSPASSVSYSTISPHLIKTIENPSVEKTVTTPIGYTKIVQSPAYQSILTTKEHNYESPDGTQHATYTKSYDTAYSSLNKYESELPKNGELIGNTIPSFYSSAVHSPVYHPGAAYTVSSPLVHTIHSPTLTKSVSGPLTYTTHDIPLTETVVSPTSYSTPVFDKTKYVTSGLSSYSSNAPIIESQPIKTTITYSEAPLVSHMSFTGLGTSYAW